MTLFTFDDHEQSANRPGPSLVAFDLGRPIACCVWGRNQFTQTQGWGTMGRAL